MIRPILSLYIHYRLWLSYRRLARSVHALKCGELVLADMRIRWPDGMVTSAICFP